MNFSQNNWDITIVGGGFAGLSAALRLQRAGARIQLVEKRPFFGGRAYSFRDKITGETLDNGQHLFMGCYHETLNFLRALGTSDRLSIQDSLSLAFVHPPATLHRLRCPNLPSPLHLAWGLTAFSGLTWRDKWSMARLLREIKKGNSNGHDLDQISVRGFLEKHGQTTGAIEKFWEPIGLGALNESIDLASAGLFLEVLRRALLSSKADSSLALSRVGLSELYAEPMRRFLEEQGVPIFFQTRIRGIFREGTAFRLITDRGEELKSPKILFAVPPNALAKIFSESGGEFRPLLPELHRFTSSPIVSINLWLEGFRPPETMTGLIGSPVHWVFDKSKILSGERASHVTLVISGASSWAEVSKERLVEMALGELRKFFPSSGGKLIHSQVVKEFDATFGTRVGLNTLRPPNTTAVPGLFLAGDWTDTSLPATIESAVLSGHRAAEQILHS